MRTSLHLPVDLVVADRFAADADVRAIDAVDVPVGWMGLDIAGAPRTATRGDRARRDRLLERSDGRVRAAPFAAGTRVVAEAVANASRTTVVGGGDSVSALRSFGLTDTRCDDEIGDERILGLPAITISPR